MDDENLTGEVLDTDTMRRLKQAAEAKKLAARLTVLTRSLMKPQNRWLGDRNDADDL